MTAPIYLRNADSVVKAFGYWPRFHDAPVIAFEYDQARSGTVHLTLHCWEMTSEVDEHRFFKLIKHHLVSFAFYGIAAAHLDHFSRENILFDLAFSSADEFDASGRFSVTLDSAMGSDLCGSFVASAGEVLEIVPCDKQGRKIEPGTPGDESRPPRSP